MPRKSGAKVVVFWQITKNTQRICYKYSKLMLGLAIASQGKKQEPQDFAALHSLLQLNANS